MSKQTTPIPISRRKILMGCVYLVAAAALTETYAANPKERDNLMTANTTDAMMAQTQSEEGKNKEIIHEGFAKWANGTGSFFDLLADDVE
jgi:hypothetical protein